MHIVSDGFSGISIFSEKRINDSSDELLGASHKSAIHAYNAIVQDHKVSVVSEIPFNAVQLISKFVNAHSGITIQ